MHVPFLAPILLVIASVFVVGAASGCGGGDNDGRCSSCVNGSPFGPNSNDAACRALASQFDCDNFGIENANVCGQDVSANATCVVSDCEREVVCPQPGTP